MVWGLDNMNTGNFDSFSLDDTLSLQFDSRMSLSDDRQQSKMAPSSASVSSASLSAITLSTINNQPLSYASSKTTVATGEADPADYFSSLLSHVPPAPGLHQRYPSDISISASSFESILKPIAPSIASAVRLPASSTAAIAPVTGSDSSNFGRSNNNSNIIDPDTLKSNHLKFLRRYAIKEPLHSPELPSSICSREPVARAFQHCYYYRSVSGSCVLVIHPADYLQDAEWLWQKEFRKLPPMLPLPAGAAAAAAKEAAAAIASSLTNNTAVVNTTTAATAVATSWYQCFAVELPSVERLTSLLRNVRYVAEVGLEAAMLHFGLNCYIGKVLHVTSGSGKTTLRRSFFLDSSSSPSTAATTVATDATAVANAAVAAATAGFRIVDTDDMLVQEITLQYPYFRLKKQLSPAENIFKFCKNMKRKEVSNVFDAVRSKALRFAAEGFVVLTSAVGLMDMADYVLVQRNPRILKDRYEAHRELEAANFFGKVVTFVDDYLSNVLSCRPEQI